MITVLVLVLCSVRVSFGAFGVWCSNWVRSGAHRTFFPGWEGEIHEECLMFTPQPQRRGWSLTPRAAEKNGSTPSQGRSAGGGLMGKGKGVAVSEAPPPPRASLDENGTEGSEEGRDAAVWKRFQEAGLLDQASLEKKDREALVQRISKLEAEVSGKNKLNCSLFLYPSVYPPSFASYI